MKIKKYLSFNRRDFSAIYVCQFCGHEKTHHGYDDDYFHQNVIPCMECPVCKKSIHKNGHELAEEYIPDATKYPANQEV